MSYYFYILRCADNTLYCGQTNDLVKRLAEHNSGNSRGAKYTRGRRPVALAYYEKHASLRKALKREAEVKKWKKDRKEKLVRDFHF